MNSSHRNKPIRLLQAIAGGSQGGAEQFFTRLANGFNRAGIEQHIILRKNRLWSQGLQNASTTITELPFRQFFDFQTHLYFNRVIRQYKPDVVLTWMNRATFYCPKAVSGHRFIKIARLGGYYNLKYYKSCDHLIGNTEDIVNYCVTQGWPSNRVHYIGNFVNDAPASPVTRSMFNTPDDVPLILALGRLHTNKAFDNLIVALHKLPNTYAWIAGEGPLEGKLKSLANSLGVTDRLRFLGWRTDVPSLLSTADIFVCPSRVEPLGNTILEAWAHHVPVVACNAIGPRNLILSGETGLLTPIDDPEALANSINTLIENTKLSERLAVSGYAMYKTNFAEDIIVERFQSLFHKVCD